MYFATSTFNSALFTETNTTDWNVKRIEYIS